MNPRTTRNLPCDTKMKIKITESIIDDIKKGFVLGPLDKQPPGHFQLACGGVYKKVPLGSHKEPKARPIHHASHPRKTRTSLNDGIPQHYKSVKFISFEQLVSMIQNLGEKAWLFKSDAESAYRQIPVHPEDQKFLSSKWFGMWFRQPRLVFGVGSAVFIYTELITKPLEFVLIKIHPSLHKAKHQRLH